MASDAGEIYAYAASKFPEPKEGDLRIYWFAQIPCKQFVWPVPDPKTAAIILDMLASYDDHQFAIHVKGDYSNGGGLMIFRNGDWEDWESDDCDDFETWREENKL